MTRGDVEAFCARLPGATTDVKWGHDLCFLVGGKMFAVMPVASHDDPDVPPSISFKATPDVFADLIRRGVGSPAPYLARACWVRLDPAQVAGLGTSLHDLLAASHHLVWSKLPRRLRGG